MSLDGENAVAKLPSAFQSLSTPTSSTISKAVELNPNAANHLHGYRSNFNVNEEKAKYQQQRQPVPPPLPSPATHQQNLRQPYHHQVHNKPRNNERFGDNNNQRNNFRADSGGGHCEVCDRNFKTQQQLDRHMNEHEKCCFEGCKFEAHSSLLKKHIEAQHNSGLFQRIGKIETDEDIEKWREERRKRYPTKANIEARQLAQEQRLKRGERIAEPNDRFGKKCDRRSANEGNFDRKEHNKSTVNEKKKRTRRRRNNKGKNAATKTNQSKGNESSVANESITENVGNEIVRFAGISHMTVSNESTPAVESEKKNNALTALMGLYGDDDDDDDDDDSDEGPEEVTATKSNDTNVVSESEKPAVIPAEGSQAGVDIEKLNSTEANDSIPVLIGMDCNSDDDEVPEVQSISREPLEEDKPNESKSLENETVRKRRNEPATTEHGPQRKIAKKQSIFDLTKKIRHQNSLLEKLLQKDIRHERNVVLQCVRYVVDNDFFGVGQSTKK